MFEIKVDEDELKAIYQAEIQRKLEEVEFQSLLMNSKQLCDYLSLSWPTVEKIFLRDPNFPKMRVGTKWVFHRGEVQAYVNQWSRDVKKRGGIA